jgi:A/G-specific adenine glycosylase
LRPRADTAASVSSIAYGEAAAAVDGNVVRVLSRLHALAQANPASSAATKQMQALVRVACMPGRALADTHAARQADSVLCRRRPGDWNQAVMELGAVVCKPQAPRCDACPVASCCAALKRVQDAAAADAPPPLPAVTDFPTRVAKAPRRVEAVCVRVVEWQNSDADATWLLMLKRPEGGLLSGLWEFPAAARLQDVAATLAALGLPEANGPATPAVQFVHVFSHVEHHMAVERITLLRSTPPPELARDGGTPWRWVQQPAEGGAPPGLTGGVGKAWSAVFSQPRAPATKGRKKPRT